MTDFVEQCRREWSRLHVPDPLADEMAADLASDLADAEAEGISVEELLGSSARDPRAFAAAWAAERGIIPQQPSRKTRRKPLFLVAFTTLAAIVVLGSALALLTGEPKVSLITAGNPRAHLPTPPAGAVGPPGRSVLETSAAAPIEWVLLVLAIVALGFAAWLWSSWGRTRAPGATA